MARFPLPIFLISVGVLCSISCAAQQRDKNSLRWFQEFMDTEFKKNSGLPVNGVYYTFFFDYGGKAGHSLYLYSNGSFIEGEGLWKLPTSDTEKFIEEVVNYDSRRPMLPEFWGLYKVVGDTLKTVRVALNPSVPGSFNLVTTKWIIRGRNLFMFSRGYLARFSMLKKRKWNFVEVQDKQGNRFFSTEIKKPDSTIAWFYGEKWFQRK